MQLNKRLTPIMYSVVFSMIPMMALVWGLNLNRGTNYKLTPRMASTVPSSDINAGSPLPTYSKSTVGDDLQMVFLPLVLNQYSNLPCDPYDNNPGGIVTGTLRIWHPTVISFSGPLASESDNNPNPFLDFRLQVYFISPGGEVYNVPGFFAGDGQGNGDGDVWQARFSPDEVGSWHYCASFRSGTDIAVELYEAGSPLSFDGASGSFTVTESALDEEGFLGWGRLEYTNSHYLKFRDGPYWIKGGTNSPENFLGYRGFDNTVDQGGVVNGFVHHYSTHFGDWNPGDPNFVNEDGTYDAKGIIGALNYLGEKNVNSIYFLPMNLGGDGQDTYPFINPGGSHFDNTHYDISKLYQWNIVFEHAQRQGVALHIVLNETEAQNRMWLDNGTLGVERKLFYRELAARFAYLLAIKWNLSEESVFSTSQLFDFAKYLGAQDWADHVIAVHTPSNNTAIYPPLMGNPLFSATSFQYRKDGANDYTELWRTESETAGRPWVVDMDENNPAAIGLTDNNADELRKEILYDVYFSGGNIEWYAGYHDPPLGGDMQLENFRTRETMWNYMWYARRFMEENLPFWEMNPADELLDGEADDFGGGEVFAKEGEIYAIYLPSAMLTGTLDVGNSNGDYHIQWYNPRSGDFISPSVTTTVTNGVLPLGSAPFEPDEDWVILVINSLSPYAGNSLACPIDSFQKTCLAPES